jgi:hypothetical protein
VRHLQSFHRHLCAEKGVGALEAEHSGAGGQPPQATEEEIAWLLVKEMSKNGARPLPVLHGNKECDLHVV